MRNSNKILLIIIVILFFGLAVTKTAAYITEQKILKITNEQNFYDDNINRYPDEIIRV